MQKTLKHILLLLVALATACLSACRDMTDDNGEFGGFWVLKEVVRDGAPVAIDSKYVITWGVHKELLRIYDSVDGQAGSGSIKYYCTFERTAQSLQLTKLYRNNWSEDVAIAFSDAPSHLFVPEDGTYHIDVLGDDEMLLSYGTTRLRFWHY